MPISYFADNTGAPRHTDLHNVFWKTSSAYHRGISGANRWKETGEMSPEVFGVDPIDTNPNKTLSLLDWANSFPCARNIQPRLLSVNEYFPRIYRPGASAMQSQDVMKQSAVAVQVLCDRLAACRRDNAMANYKALRPVRSRLFVPDKSHERIRERPGA